jgi:hypothetical protein
MRAIPVLGLSGLLVILAVVPAAARVPARQNTPPPSASGAIAEQVALLLDGAQAVIDKMGGGAAETDLGHDLSVLANFGRDLLRDGFITPAFHTRFARVLLVLRLAVITDTGRILAPIVNREFIAFVRSVTGKTYDPDGPPSQQIALFSDAVATEVTRLRALKR